MRALHLPGLSQGIQPFSFPSLPPPPSSLLYTPQDSPLPKPPSPPAKPIYLISISHTALTHNELTWRETLLPSQFHRHGGPIPGHDLVGTIKDVFGPATEHSDTDTDTGKPKFNIGDKVCALLAFDRPGAAAQYTLAEEHELALIPPSLVSRLEEEGEEGWEKLATVPLSGLSAWQALFEYAGLAPPTITAEGEVGNVKGNQGKRVLVTGASGSVGVQAVQMAKAAGCWVVGTCSQRNEDFVRELGVDEVLDYTRFGSLEEGFERLGVGAVDAVVDTVGKETLVQAVSEKVVSRGGKVVSLAMGLQDCGDEGKIAEKAVEGRGVKFTFFIVKPSGEQLGKILKLVDAKRVQGVVGGVYDLEKGREAMEIVEGGKVRGKIVLKVGEVDGE